MERSHFDFPDKTRHYISPGIALEGSLDSTAQRLNSWLHEPDVRVYLSVGRHRQLITIVVSLMSMIVQAAVALLSLAMASRYLNADLFSTWALASATFAFVGLLDAGTSMVVQRNLASQLVDLMDDAKRLAKTILVVLGGIGLALFVVAITFHSHVYAAMVGAMMVRVSVNVLGAAMVATGAVVPERYCRMLSALVFVLVQYWLLDTGFGVQSWAPSALIAATTYLAVAFVWSPQVREIIIRTPVVLSLFRKYQSHHINWLFYTIPGLFIYNFQVFALRLWSTVEAVGVFSTAHQLYFNAISVFSITSILSSVAISSQHYGRSERRNSTVLSNLQTNTFLVALALVAVTILLRPLGQVLFPGIALEQSWGIFAVYGLILIVEAAQMALTNAVISAGETNFKMVNIASAMLNVAGCFVLVPSLGIAGAILSVGLAQLLTCNFFNIRKAIRYLSLPAGSVLRTLGGAMLTYGGLVFAHWLAHQGPGQLGNAIDACIVLAILISCLVFLLPRVLQIVDQYRQTNAL